MKKEREWKGIPRNNNCNFSKSGKATCKPKEILVKAHHSKSPKTTVRKDKINSKSSQKRIDGLAMWEKIQMTSDFNKNHTNKKVEAHSFSGAERNVNPESNIQWQYPSKLKRMSWAWWYSLVISALGELRQESCACQSSLSYKAKTYGAGPWVFDHAPLSI